jgi:hypothetical protein
MTSSTPPVWDDERIGAAYLALTNTRVPDEIRRSAARTAVVDGPRGERPWGKLLAAAVVVLVVGAVSIASISTRGETGPAASASAVPQTGLPSATVSASPSAALQVIDVGALVALQKGAAVDARELAVHGYLSPFPIADCPHRGELPGLVLGCRQSFRFLMQDPEILWSTTSGNWTSRRPNGPAVNPRLIETLGDEETGTPERPPREVIAVGHLDDDRAEQCPADQRDDCRRAFVVDRLLPADAPIDLDPPQMLRLPGITFTPTDVVTEVASQAGMPPQVLVLGIFDGRASLATVQPAIDLTQRGGPFWLMRLLGADGFGRTFAVEDGSEIVYEFGRYGVKQVVRPSA